jgi:hypothetical protein
MAHCEDRRSRDSGRVVCDPEVIQMGIVRIRRDVGLWEVTMMALLTGSTGTNPLTHAARFSKLTDYPRMVPGLVSRAG